MGVGIKNRNVAKDATFAEVVYPFFVASPKDNEPIRIRINEDSELVRFECTAGIIRGGHSALYVDLKKVGGSSMLTGVVDLRGQANEGVTKKGTIGSTTRLKKDEQYDIVFGVSGGTTFSNATVVFVIRPLLGQETRL